MKPGMDESEKVADLLRQATEVVLAAGIPEELQPVAFGRAFDLLAGTTRRSDQARGTIPTGAEDNSAGLLERIASRLHLDREIIAETFEEREGGIRLVVAPSKLDPQKTKGTKQVALLVSAARQAAGLEDSTPAKAIRLEAEDYGKYDSPNFAATISDLGEYFSMSGSGPNRRFKLRRAGFEEAAALIQRLYAG
jgi:hypothetical protein